MEELSQDFRLTVENLKITEMKLISLETERKKAQITMAHLEGTVKNSKIFRQAGRAFLQTPIEELTSSLFSNMKQYETEMLEFNKQREQLLKKRSELEKAILDLHEKMQKAGNR